MRTKLELASRLQNGPACEPPSSSWPSVVHSRWLLAATRAATPARTTAPLKPTARTKETRPRSIPRPARTIRRRPPRTRRRLRRTRRTRGMPAQDGTFAATVDNAAPTADLGMTATLKVTVTPAMGFTGQVDLDVTGLPATVTAKWDMQTPTISDTTPAVANVTLTAGVTAQADTLPIVVTAKSHAKSTIASTANVNFKINPQITVAIPLNFSAMMLATSQSGIAPLWGPAFGAGAAPLTAPKDGSAIVVKMTNLDSTAHEIHGNNSAVTSAARRATASFPHGVGLLQQGQTDSVNRSIKAGNTYNGYLHDLGATSSTGFVVQVGN